MSKWKKAEEVLPEKSGEYIVAFCFGRKYIDKCSIRDFPEDTFVSTVAFYDSIEKLWMMDHVCYNALIKLEDKPFNCCYISHWMELPELPKE